MSNFFEIAIDDQVDRKAAERAERLMPGGVPRYIRIWDNGGESFDQYTVVFTKKSNAGNFMYVGMSENPFSPQGFGQHGETQYPNGGKHLGKRIKFDQLPEDCQKLVIQDYKELWDL